LSPDKIYPGIQEGPMTAQQLNEIKKEQKHARKEAFTNRKKEWKECKRKV
jgi:hypothetical protein